MKRELRIHISGGGKIQPFWLSFIKSAVLASVLFGPGILVGSSAMQCAGFVVMLVLSAMSLIAASAEGMTIKDARKRLDQLEAEAEN